MVVTMTLGQSIEKNRTNNVVKIKSILSLLSIV